jgi:SPW repeat
MHLMTDYLVVALLVISPWLFGFSEYRTAMLTVVVVGVFVLAPAAMTEPRGRPRNVLA